VFVLQVLSKDAVKLKLIFDECLGEWSQQRDNKVSYVVASDLPVTSRDWIGLYKVSRFADSCGCVSCNTVTLQMSSDISNEYMLYHN